MGQTTEGVTWATIRDAAQWSAAQAQWVIAELKGSGLSTRLFAEKHRVGLKRVYYWQARLKTQGSPVRVPTGLVEVRVPQPAARSLTPSAPTRMEIELLSGRRLSVSESVDFDRLRELVALLEQE